jgi:hypothetical protein
MRRVVDRLSFANVVSVVALFVALGGLATALPGHNTVKPDDVADARFRPLPSVEDCDPAGDPWGPPVAAVDAEGIVHLMGAYEGCIGSTLDILPKRYRPATVIRAAGESNGSPAVIEITKLGVMSTFGGTTGEQSISGISYERR